MAAKLRVDKSRRCGIRACHTAHFREAFRSEEFQRGCKQGTAEDIQTLLGLVNFLGPGKTFCAHAPGAVEPLGSAIKYFRSEFEAGVASSAASTPTGQFVPA